MRKDLTVPRPKLARENAETLSIRVPKGTQQMFKDHVPEGFKIGYAMEACVRLWCSLPEAVRIQQLSTEESDLHAMIEAIVKEKVTEEVDRKMGALLGGGGRSSGRKAQRTS